MVRDIYGHVSDLPAGCITETDIYTDTGALLCPMMTVIDDKRLQSLSSYKGMIHATISYVDESLGVNISDVPLPDDSVSFDESFKQYAVESLSNLYSNIEDVETLTSGVVEIGQKVCAFIDGSKELGINLSKLKVSDEYTYKHSVDVGTMAAILAKALGEPEAFVQDVAVAGLLHDIGKENIPPEIINKPTKLSIDEFEMIKTHPVHGYKLLMDSANITEEIRQGVLNHHENVDGSGYPRALTDDKIGKMGKILAIVDVYDALVTKRPYKEAKSPAEAIEIMFTMSNKFDIDYFRTFLSVINIYPNGSVIKLSNGETGVVLRQNKSYPLRPVIKITSVQTIVDLSINRDYLGTVIVA